MSHITDMNLYVFACSVFDYSIILYVVKYHWSGVLLIISYFEFTTVPSNLLHNTEQHLQGGPKNTKLSYFAHIFAKY